MDLDLSDSIRRRCHDFVPPAAYRVLEQLDVPATVENFESVTNALVEALEHGVRLGVAEYSGRLREEFPGSELDLDVHLRTHDDEHPA